MNEPDFTGGRTQVFKPKTVVGDDPQSQLVMELGNHLGDLIANATTERVSSEDSMSEDIRKAGRNYVLKIALALLVFLGGGGAGFYQFGGPAEATHEAHAANEKASEKITELDGARAELQNLKTEIEKDRRARVNGRLSGVEQRVAAVEGQVAGIRVGTEALLDAALTQKGAKKAKAEAKAAAAKVEKAAKASLTADAKAE